ncbi:MobF family relaxase [Acidipila sp. EB88]|uniref:MobF family relaxase n=1 Tax=Acidipila sp. EB88 TaxID=2305226 RepID=UPI000F5E1C3E|nr:MobF family relaxase [Acidipila sp. EB88]RRA50461.1 conjugative relaxase [Acidipila sp. EB88]
MLNISKALEAGQAQTYHQKEFASAEANYWAKGAPAYQGWQGALAAEMGLEGSVSAEHFARLTEGQHPQTGEQLIRHKTSAAYTTQAGKTVTPMQHRAGWDATFSAPKSVSLVALVGGDDRVRLAHREAVSSALAQLEQYTYARLGGSRQAEQTGKFVAAKFEHDTARPVDGYAAPQLHTHAVIFNMTRRDDGTMRAVESQGLHDTQGFATAVYQSELTYRLRELGYEIEPGQSGAPEIAGISRAYIEASSPRSQKIKEYMQEHELEGPAAAQIAAYTTRQGKIELEPAEVLAAHAKIAAQHGNEADKATAAAQTRGSLRQDAAEARQAPKRAHEAISYARDRSFEREAVADERDLLRDALRHGMGHLRYREVRPAFEQRTAAGEFREVQARKHESGRKLTTPQTIALEQASVAHVTQGPQFDPVLRPEAAAAHVASNAQLNQEQRQAVQEVLTSPDRVHGLQGLAGTGKTTTLRTIREAAERQGYSVEGFAPTSKAAGELRAAGISATTLQRFLTRGGDKRQTQDPDARRYYMLDESSLASTRQMQDFLAKIGPQDRVLLIGDTRQHQGVDAGKPFEQMQDAGMRTSRLDTIVRQRRNPKLLAAVEKLSQNETRKGISMLAEQGRIAQVEDRDERIQAIAKAYATQPESTIIVSPDNASRRAINAAVREEMQQRGLLSREDTQLPTLIPRNDMTGADRSWASQYRPGDVLRYAKGSKKLGIERGGYTSIEAVDRAKNRISVRTEDGRLLNYDPRRVKGIAAYQGISRSFASGDRIRFTAPNQAMGLANGDMATIQRIDGDRVVAALDAPAGQERRAVTFDAKTMRHFDHGYAVTSHSSQGVTAKRVLVNMDTQANRNLINTRFAYVAVSRAAEEAQIFTNDGASLGQRLSRDISKPAAVAFTQTSTRRNEQAQFREGLSL